MAEDFNEVFAIKDGFKLYFAINRVITTTVPLTNFTPLRLVVLFRVETTLVISCSSVISSNIFKRRLISNSEIINL